MFLTAETQKKGLLSSKKKRKSPVKVKEEWMLFSQRLAWNIFHKEGFLK